MKFELTTPCKDCPFRRDVLPFLSTHRAEEIGESIMSGNTFTCHKKSHTTGWDLDKDEQHCAGATILLEKNDRPNQMMRWMERIGMYDRTELNMDAKVFDNVEEFVLANSDWNGDTDPDERD